MRKLFIFSSEVLNGYRKNSSNRLQMLSKR